MSAPSSPAGTRASFHPLSPEFREDPYATYRRLQAEAPAAWAAAPVPGFWGFWFVSRHADVVAGLKAPQFGREVERALPPGSLPPTPPEHRPLTEMLAHWMLFKDPPDHGRLRRLVSRALDATVLERVRPRIAALSHQLLDAADGRETLDLIGDFAYPLPLLLVSELLGVPETDYPRLRELFRQVILALDLTRTDEHLRRAAKITTFFLDYFRALAAEQTRSPRDNLLGALIAARDGEQRLTTDELAANCVLLLYAGHEATTHTLGNGVLALLQHPDQLRRLRREPALLQAAVEEILRFESPQQIAFRYALDDAEIAGAAIRRGQVVAFGLGAANRDPAVFLDPDRFDITRPPSRHLAFGHGLHTCVGLRLGRLEAQIALQILLERLPRMVLRGFERQQSIIVRGLHRLEVETGGAS
ncbi:MAG: cytochrome P450 [Armatimonadota bacterium]